MLWPCKHYKGGFLKNIYAEALTLACRWSKSDTNKKIKRKVAENEKKLTSLTCFNFSPNLVQLPNVPQNFILCPFLSFIVLDQIDCESFLQSNRFLSHKYWSSITITKKIGNGIFVWCSHPFWPHLKGQLHCRVTLIVALPLILTSLRIISSESLCSTFFYSRDKH